MSKKPEKKTPEKDLRAVKATIPLDYPDFQEVPEGGKAIKALEMEIPRASNMPVFGSNELPADAFARLCNVERPFLENLHAKDFYKVNLCYHGYQLSAEEKIAEQLKYADHDPSQPLDFDLWYKPEGYQKEKLKINVPRGYHSTDAEAAADTNAGREIHMLASLVEREERFIQGLHICDYARLQIAYQSFLI